jgi:hypothetical protein
MNTKGKQTFRWLQEWVKCNLYRKWGLCNNTPYCDLPRPTKLHPT